MAIGTRSNGNGRSGSVANGAREGYQRRECTNGNGASHHRPKPRVFVGTENRLLREALSRMLSKHGEIEVITSEAAEFFITARKMRYIASQPSRKPSQIER